jgi:hypothetical protein
MKNVILLIAFSVILFSCTKEQDNQAPEIRAVRVNGVMADEHELEAGTVFNVQLALSDDMDLNQVKVSVHPADDGHSHEGESSESNEPNIGVWSASVIVNLSGTEENRTVQMSVPAEVAGYWHLEVLLIDKAGNEAEEYITTLHVENPNLPVITLSSTPAVADGHIELEPGNPLNFSVTVTDADGVASLVIHIEDESGNEVFEAEADAAGATSFTSDMYEVTFPEAGHYHLHVTATDAGGLVNEREWEIHAE